MKAEMKFIARGISALLIVGMAGCGAGPTEPEGSGHAVLKPVAEAANAANVGRHFVYVPAYSSIYWGFDNQRTELGVTLSIRNVSTKHSIQLQSAKYYGSDGKELRDLVEQPGLLGPLATADFVIQRRDTAGGPGASFLVEWSSNEDVDPPVIESVMLGQHGNAGVSFTSPGRPLTKADAELRSGK